MIESLLGVLAKLARFLFVGALDVFAAVMDDFRLAGTAEGPLDMGTKEADGFGPALPST